MRLLSVFMSRTKSGSKSSSEVHSLLCWTLLKNTHWLVLWVQILRDWIVHSKCRVFFCILQSSSLISNATATALLSLGAIEYCLHVLKSLLEFWKSQQGEEEPVAASQLLRPHTASSPPDMSPFFLRQYVKVVDLRKWSHLMMFESRSWWLYLCVVLGTCCWCVWSLLPAFDWNGAQAALPNQKDCWHQPTNSTSCLWPFLVLLSLWGEHKFITTTVFFTFLAFIDRRPQCHLLIFTFLFCQYLMIQQTPFVRRQVRKLLLFICGSKEKYRQLRDLHTLDSHMRSIKKLLEEQGIFLRAGVVTATSGSALQYDTLISLVSVHLAETCLLSFPVCDQFILYFVAITWLDLLQMEHLKACAEIATQRTINWQKFCMKDDCT